MGERINQFQVLMNVLGEQGQRARQGTGMTLGSLIDRLKELPPDAMVENGGPLHSYRGYYSDLALECGESRTVAEVLADAGAAMGATFEGYKGGTYRMVASTPVWSAYWGSVGERLFGLTLVDGIVRLDTGPEPTDAWMYADHD